MPPLGPRIRIHVLNPKLGPPIHIRLAVSDVPIPVAVDSPREAPAVAEQPAADLIIVPNNQNAMAAVDRGSPVPLVRSRRGKVPVPKVPIDDEARCNRAHVHQPFLLIVHVIQGDILRYSHGPAATVSTDQPRLVGIRVLIALRICYPIPVAECPVERKVGATALLARDAHLVVEVRLRSLSPDAMLNARLCLHKCRGRKHPA